MFAWAAVSIHPLEDKLDSGSFQLLIDGGGMIFSFKKNTQMCMLVHLRVTVRNLFMLFLCLLN